MTAPSSDSKAPIKSKLGAVLLVDDEKPLIELYAEALAPHFETTLATSTREVFF